MSQSCVEILQKALDLNFIWTRGLTSLWHLGRHEEFSASNVHIAWHFLNIVRNPNITVPTRKWPSVSCHTCRSIRIVLPSQFRFMRYPSYLDSCPDVSEQTQDWMAIPAETREYTPGSHCNSRKTMRLTTRRETRSNYPAWHAEQYHIPNPTHKETLFAWWNSRESSRKSSQV